jgi:hypothetical protein
MSTVSTLGQQRTTSEVLGRDGKVALIIHSVVDITERIQAERRQRLLINE